MLKKHTGVCKQGFSYTDGDPAPTWEDRLKNQMGYGQMSDLARKVHGKDSGKHPGVEDATKILSDMGVKTTTENYTAEEVEDRSAARGKKII
jgi:hypothetical protein